MSDSEAGRSRGWLIIPAALLLAVPVASWAIGRGLQSQLEDYRKPLLQAVPWMHIVARRYEQGVFSSREELDVEIELDAQPQKFTILNELQHGPFPGSLRPALARVRSTVKIPADANATVRKLFDGKNPVQVLTMLWLGGGGHSEVTIPEIDTLVGPDRAHVTWQGFKGEFDFSRDARHVEAQASAPMLRVLSGENSDRVELSGFSLVSTGDRVFEDLYSGRVEIKLDRMQVVSRASPGIDARGVRYSGDVPVNGEFVDLSTRIQADQANIGGQQYGPAEYSMSLRHLHGPTLATLTRDFQRIAELKRSATTPAAPDAPADAALMATLRQLLLAQPRLVIDRISASTPQGPFSIVGEAHFVGLKAEDIGNNFAAMSLLSKLEAQADLSVPAAWADSAAALKNRAASAAATDPAGALETPPAPDGADPAVADGSSELDALVRRGFIDRKGDIVTTRIELRQGKLLLNGRAFGE